MYSSNTAWLVVVLLDKPLSLSGSREVALPGPLQAYAQADSCSEIGSGIESSWDDDTGL